MFGLPSLAVVVLGLWLYFLKRRPPPAETEWRKDVADFEKALARRDGDRISAQFDGLRRDAGAGHHGGQDHPPSR
jgi:hypothetical protein